MTRRQIPEMCRHDLSLTAIPQGQHLFQKQCLISVAEQSEHWAYTCFLVWSLNCQLKGKRMGRDLCNFISTPFFVCLFACFFIKGFSLICLLLKTTLLIVPFQATRFLYTVSTVKSLQPVLMDPLEVLG